MPAVGKPVEIHATFRFRVSIDGENHAAFTECTLPSLDVETTEIKEGGQNEYSHQLPVRVKAGPVKLRRGLTKDSKLLEWYMDVLQGNRAKMYRTVTVTMLDSMENTVATWTFNRAYPTKWVGPTLKAGDKAIAIEELELAHHGIDVE